MTLKLGIAGLGTVGTSVIKGIVDTQNMFEMRAGRGVEITGICARNRADRGIDVTPYTWYDDASQLATHTDIDVFVELIGGADGIAYDSVKKALQAGKIVITANKAMLAQRGEELAKIAEANTTTILYESAIGGGIPVVKALREGLGANRIDAIYGILNGTCNYIMTTMEQTGRSFADVLQEAQALGYAESDPSFDVDGLDAGQKLAVLASLGFGIQGAYTHMHIQSIRDCMEHLDVEIAGKLGYTPRLVGVAKRQDTGVLLYMAPAFVPKDGTFGGVVDVMNACTIQGNLVGKASFIGAGAGGDATASSVLADVLDVACGRVSPIFNQSVHTLAPTPVLPMEYRTGRYYVRAQMELITLMEILDDANIQVQGIQSQSPYTAIITNHTVEHHMKQALDGISCVLHRIEEC